MKMTHGEFKAALIGARFMEASLPHLKCETYMLVQYTIDDTGVYYLPACERELANLGAVMWQNVKERAGLNLDVLEKALRSPGWYEPACRVIQ